MRRYFTLSSPGKTIKVLLFLNCELRFCGESLCKRKQEVLFLVLFFLPHLEVFRAYLRTNSTQGSFLVGHRGSHVVPENKLKLAV